MNKKWSEAIALDLDMTDATTAASTSRKYDMSRYDQGMIAVGIRSTGFTTVTVDLMEATAATAAGSSDCAGRTGRTIGAQGGTGVTTAGGVMSMTLTLASATSESYTLAIGGVSRTLTQSATTTLRASSAQTTSVLYFASSVGTTAAGGIKAHLDDLSTKLTNSTYGFGSVIQTATDATNTLKITVLDAADGPITFAGGAAAASLSVLVQEAVVGFDFRADELSTGGNRYVGVKVSTAGVACERNTVTIRGPGRYMPNPTFKGYIST